MSKERRLADPAGQEPMRKKSSRNRPTRGRPAYPARAEELMAIALELFARRDFADVTIKDIGNAAGVNTALIYYYFDSKEDLFQATLRHAVAQTLDRYRRLQERYTDPVGLIHAWFDTHVQLFEPIRQLVKIMLDYAVLPTAKRTVVDDVIRRFYDEERKIISESVRRGMAVGLFKPVDPDAMAKLVSTYLDGIMVRSMIHRNFDTPRAIKEFEQMFWGNLGYRPDKPGGPDAGGRGDGRRRSAAKERPTPASA